MPLNPFLVHRVGTGVGGYTQEIEILEFLFIIRVGLLNRQQGKREQGSVLRRLPSQGVMRISQETESRIKL